MGLRCYQCGENFKGGFDLVEHEQTQKVSLHFCSLKCVNEYILRREL